MKLGHILKTILVQKDTTAKHVAKMMGITPQALGNMMSRENITIESLTRILNVLDYEIIIQPRKKGVYPQGSYPVDMVDRGVIDRGVGTVDRDVKGVGDE